MSQSEFDRAWELVESGDFSGAFKLFNESMGYSSVSDVKTPGSYSLSFEGIPLKEETSSLSDAAAGAWYCQIRMAQAAGDDGDDAGEFIETAIRYAEYQRSMETIETIQLNREMLSWGYSAELMAKEEKTIPALEDIKSNMRKIRNKIYNSKTSDPVRKLLLLSMQMQLDEDGFCQMLMKLPKEPVRHTELSRRMMDLYQRKSKILEELKQSKIGIYRDWLSFQDKSEIRWHLPHEEYDPLTRLEQLVYSEISHPMAFLYYMYQAHTGEVVILSDVWYPDDSKEPEGNGISHKLERNPLPDSTNISRLKNRYNALVKQRNPHTLKGFIYDLDKLLLPGDLPEVEYVLVVPDSNLEWVPWELLGISKGTPLGLRYNMVKTPSLDIFRLSLERRSRFDCIRQIKRNHNLSAVLFGNPSGDLPGAEAEVKDAADYLSNKDINTTVIKGKDATIDEFHRISKEVDIIHFACHGIFHKEDPMLSNLKFSDGRVFPRLIAGLGLLNSSILVLNSCESGIVGSTGGETQGLISAFISGGCGSVTATNWPIGDNAARKMALYFYGQLLKNEDTATALKNARNEMKNASLSGENLFDWAAYTLYGDPFRCLRVEPAEDIELAVWKLIQSIGGPDERLSWNAAHALEDIRQQSPDLLKNLLLEGIVQHYDDWDAALTIPRLVWFANQDVIDKKFLRNILTAAYKEMEEEFYEPANLYHVQQAMEELKSGRSTYNVTRAQVDPTIKSLLSDIDITGDESGVQKFATDDEYIDRLVQALDSGNSQLMRTAAKALADIMDFDYEFANYDDYHMDAPIFSALKKCIHSDDLKVRKIIFNGLMDSEWLHNKEVVKLLEPPYNSTERNLRQDASEVLRNAFQKAIEFESVGVIRTVGDILSRAMKSDRAEVRSCADQDLVEVLEFHTDTHGVEDFFYHMTLNAVIDNPDAGLRGSIFEALFSDSEWFEHSGVIDALCDTISHSEPLIRKRSAETLAEAMYEYISDELKQKIAGVLKNAVDDADEDVRSIVEEALEDYSD